MNFLKAEMKLFFPFEKCFKDIFGSVEAEFVYLDRWTVCLRGVRTTSTRQNTSRIRCKRHSLHCKLIKVL